MSGASRLALILYLASTALLAQTPVRDIPLVPLEADCPIGVRATLSDDPARPLRQHRQNPQRLLLQPDQHAMLPQLHGGAVQFVHSEADLARHPSTPLQPTLPQNKFGWSPVEEMAVSHRSDEVAQ
jgi:hypothetical protein